MAKRDLNHSEQLDINRWSDAPEVNGFVGRIWRTHFEAKFSSSGVGKRHTCSPKEQLKVLLVNLYEAWETDPTLLVGVGMTDSSYKVSSIYNKLGISKVMGDLVRHANKIGLVDWHKGSESAGKRTRIWPTELLLAEFKDAKFSILDIGFHPDQEVIILNGGEFETTEDESKKGAKSIEYKDSDNPLIPKMRADLRSYNELISNTFIDIPTLDNPIVKQTTSRKGKEEIKRVHIGQTNKLVRRIFYRGSWELGGRFHGGWWQQINSHWRKQIYINDEPTVEQDYSGLHVNLLYGLKRLEVPGDPYDLDPIAGLGMTAEEQRKCVKSLVLMAINAKTEKKAFQAFRSDQVTGSRIKGLKDEVLKTALDAFKEKNKPIADDLCADKGVELMAIDGRITARILNEFTRRGIPILSVHDSYITSYEHTGLLRKLMNEATSEELGIKIEIKQEGAGIDQIRTFKGMAGPNYNDFHDMYRSINSQDRTEGYLQRHRQFKDYKVKKDYL